MADLVSDLKKIFSGDVRDDAAALDAASADTSIFSVQPEVVVAPKNVGDVQALVKYASEHPGVSLTARAGGTGMDGGALSESVVVDFSKYFNAIRGFGSDWGVVEPGVFYRDFEKESLKRNLLMPSYPASREICMVGGMVANNAGGELTLSYGKTEKYVRQLKAVLADGNEYVLKPLTHAELDAKLLQKDFEGEAYRRLYKLITDNYDSIQSARPKVSKNSSGYYLWNVYDKQTGIFDLTKLFVGSQGTLGLVTEITFGLAHPKKYSRMVVVFLDSFKNLGDLVRDVLAHEPTTFESYDDKTLRLALKFFGEFLKRFGLARIFSLLWHSANEAVSIITRGIPKLVLQITFDGDDPEELREKALRLTEVLKEYKPRYMELVKSPDEAQEYWLVRRESFNLLRTKVKTKKARPFIDDIVVPVETLSGFLPRLEAIIADYKEHMVYNIAGHIGNGNFHIIPLMDLTDEKARAIIPEAARRVYDLVFEFGGSTTGEHNDGIIRTPFVRQQFGGEVYALFEQTKKIFDPKNIFNPGKKVGGTMEYAIEHIVRK